MVKGSEQAYPQLALNFARIVAFAIVWVAVISLAVLKVVTRSSLAL